MSLETEGEKLLINDPIHGHIELDPLLVKIIDTPEFQRLRYIKQLGGTYYVYPGGCHNRFEHSIGVCYLAGMMVERLREKQPKLGITPQEVLCVKIAGLCHDLGHGPFSHLFEKLFIPEVFHGTKHKWDHEDASEAMFDHMLEDEDLKQEFSAKKNGLRVKEDGEFIKDLIKGTPRAHYSYEKERTVQKKFLFEIVANKMFGIDVDRWDYFARDSHSLGIPSNFDMRRTMHLVRVIECRGKDVGHHECPEKTMHICMRDNEVYNLYEMFHTRYSLHKRAYQHKVVKAVELMITDALMAANGHLKMSEAVSGSEPDVDAYTQLTDDVFQQILHSQSTDAGMQTARGILERLHKRDLYKCIFDEPCDDQILIRGQDTLTGQQIRDELVTQREELNNNIHVLVVSLSYGADPKKLLFYKKESPDKSDPIPKDEVSLLLPETFKECRIRLYVKKQNQPDLEKAAIIDCFKKWQEKQLKDKGQGSKEENGKPQEDVEMQQQLGENELVRSNSENRQGRQKRRNKRSRPY